MSKRLNWKKLLSTKRVSDFGPCKLTKSKKSQFVDIRSPFERDFDQLIFCYPFRRLQDKTQVIPFPEFDFVHTRLTHSLEVASVGRSLGKMAAGFIFNELPSSFIKEMRFCQNDIGTLVASACLAHDIGNPPFGHSGEKSISYYFTDIDATLQPYNLNHPSYRGQSKKRHCFFSEEGDKFISHDEFVYNTKKWSDLINFEGNANGFRIITNNCERGVNPTAALLGTVSKYPRESWLVKDPFQGLSPTNQPKSQSKYGLFQEQRTLFKEVATNLGLIPIAGVSKYDIAFRRHPLAFLMEAADDIANQIIDFEDGCRLGLIVFDKNYTLKVGSSNIIDSPVNILLSIAKLDASFELEKVKDNIDFKASISYLRAKVINVLVHNTFAIFAENYESIMNGTFDKALLDCVQNKIIVKNLKHMRALVRDCVYNYRPVLESEASGFEVMSSLIESLAVTSNLCIACGEIATPRQSKLQNLLPVEFRPKIEEGFEDLTFDIIYERLLKVLDYVSGMTDNYAVGLYRRIKGTSLPRL
jgi:dGTPase